MRTSIYFSPKIVGNMVDRHIHTYLHTYLHAYRWQFPPETSTDGVSLLEGHFHMSTVDSMVGIGKNVPTQGDLGDTCERVGEILWTPCKLRRGYCLLKVDNPY